MRNKKYSNVTKLKKAKKPRKKNWSNGTCLHYRVHKGAEKVEGKKGNIHQTRRSLRRQEMGFLKKCPKGEVKNKNPPNKSLRVHPEFSGYTFAQKRERGRMSGRPKAAG